MQWRKISQHFPLIVSVRVFNFHARVFDWLAFASKLDIWAGVRGDVNEKQNFNSKTIKNILAPNIHFVCENEKWKCNSMSCVMCTSKNVSLHRRTRNYAGLKGISRVCRKGGSHTTTEHKLIRILNKYSTRGKLFAFSLRLKIEVSRRWKKLLKEERMEKNYQLWTRYCFAIDNRGLTDSAGDLIFIQFVSRWSAEREETIHKA